MNLYNYSALILEGFSGERIVKIGKRSWKNISPESIHFKLLDNDLLEVKWKKYTYYLDCSNTIKYWHDGFTGCEYDAINPNAVKTASIENQYMLECAYEVLVELETLINEEGLYNAS